MVVPPLIYVRLTKKIMEFCLGLLFKRFNKKREHFNSESNRKRKGKHTLMFPKRMKI